MVSHAVDSTGRREKRRRRLAATDVLWLVLLMALRSDLDLSALWRQAQGLFVGSMHALEGVMPPVKSALSQARARLGVRPLRRLLLLTALEARQAWAPGAFYKGMRLLAIDGDSHKAPDTPENRRVFGKPSTARKAGGYKHVAGYPQVKVIRLMDVGTRICLEVLAKPFNTSEHPSAIPLLKRAQPGDLMLWDAGFYSADLLRHALGSQKHFLGPAQSQAALNSVKSLGDGSFLAKVYATDKHRHADRGGMTVRVLRYTLNDPARTGCQEEHRLVTSLLDPEQFPAKELIVLYHQRWEIEIANDEITTHLLNRDVELRSLTPNGVLQELYGLYTAHNTVRLLMCEAAKTVEIDPRTLSFTGSLRLIRESIQTMRDAPGWQLQLIYSAMITQIARQRLPKRDNRINPRVVKVVRPSNFPVKKQKHLNNPQPQREFIHSVVILN